MKKRTNNMEKYERIMKELGIYIHIPFCKQKCCYCDFISYTNKNTLIKDYVESVKKEINNIKKRAENYIVSTIYIGGGTPSFIDSKYIVEILQEINKNYNVDNNAEITIEINPGTATIEKLVDYKKAGINRLSIGLQETDNQLLQLIGRIHKYEDFLKTYKMARKVGFNNINVDLIIGLPNQTINNVKTSLKKVIYLNPEHISLYSLIVEDNTPLKRKIENGVFSLPPEEIEREEYWLAKEKLEGAGYKHYEISNFAKPGKESKHNINCWNQKEYLGFGVAAHSYFNLERYSNVETIEDYIKGSKYIIHEKQTEEITMKEYMLLGLRKIDGVQISKFKNKFGKNPIIVFKDELNILIKKDLLEIALDNIKLTNKGIDLANIVWEEFV